MQKTNRLILRPLVADDMEWIAQEVARPEVHRWLTSPPCPYGIDDARVFIERVAAFPGYRVIQRDDLPCGLITITEDEDRFDLGYWLCVEAWGQGIMTEAATALLDWHFQTHDALESGWIEGNAASENVLRKLGFRDMNVIRSTRSHFLNRDVSVVRVCLDRTGWADVDRADLGTASTSAASESKKQ